jgi:CRP-like cAMP-binding protein
MVAQKIAEGLRVCELFTTLDEKEMKVLLDVLGSACEIIDYKPGDHIFDQGEMSTKLYVIVSGQVTLSRSVNMGNKTAAWPLGLLARGRAMGWSALLYGPRYSTASAVCQKEAQIITIDGNRLRAVLESNPVIGFKVIDKLACLLGERLRAAYNTLEGHL